MAISEEQIEQIEQATLPRRRWTREEYYRMGEAGVLKPDERVELIDGEVVVKVSPQHPPHANGTQVAARTVERAFGAGYDVRRQVPLLLGSSEPEPDIAVVEGNPEEMTEHPTTAVLVVEVADSTLRADRSEKASLYASAGIPDYWIVNLIDRQLEVLRDPMVYPSARYGHAYRRSTILLPGETVRPLARPDAEIAVDALLPRAG